MWTAITQSEQRLAAGWTVWRSNPGGGEIFHTRPDRPCCPPSHIYNMYWVSFLGTKGPGRGVNHPPPSGSSWSALGRTLPFVIVYNFLQVLLSSAVFGKTDFRGGTRYSSVVSQLLSVGRLCLCTNLSYMYTSIM